MSFWNSNSDGLMNEEEFLANWSWDNDFVHPCYLKMLNSYRERNILTKAKLRVYKVLCFIWKKVAPYLWWFSLWMLELLRINFNVQKMDEKRQPPAAPLDLNIWLDVADFLDPERRQSTLLLSCSQISDAIQQRIEQLVWHSEEEMRAAGDLLIKKNGFLLYRANLLKLVGRQNFISKCRLRLVEDVTDGNGQRGDAILLAVQYTPPAVIHGICDKNKLADVDDNTLPIIPKIDRRMFEHRLLITSGKLMRGKFEQADWRPRRHIGIGNRTLYSCQIIGYTLMLKCFIQPQNQINRLPPAVAVGDREYFNDGNNIGLCKSNPSAICVEPKFWDFATFDIYRESFHCWPLTEMQCPKHFQKQEIFYFPPYHQCDDGCEEDIKAYQKLEAKAMATATMPRPKALKWKKNLPRVRYNRDLDYAHRDSIRRINGHMDVDQAARRLHYEMDARYFFGYSCDVGVRPIKEGIQLIVRSPSNYSIANSSEPVRETQCFSRIVQFPMDVDEKSIKCHTNDYYIMIIEANLKE